MPTTVDRSQRAAPFRIDVYPEREVVRVVPVGEVDLSTTGALEEQLLELRDAGFEHVVLDLREVEFLDSTGIAVILGEDQFARANARDFSLISGPPAIQRTLQICGLLGQLRFRAR